MEQKKQKSIKNKSASQKSAENSNRSKSATYEIKLRPFGYEKHVEDALITAQTIANGGPIDARKMLLGILAAESFHKSKAFTSCKLILGGDFEVHDQSKLTGKLVTPLSVTQELWESWEKSKRFTSYNAPLWGRDIITIALLTHEYHELNTISPRKTLEAIRKDWFLYVTESKNAPNNRTLNDWKAWWRAVGVSLPIKTAKNVTDSDAPLDKAYFLTWNPARHDVAKVQKFVEAIQTRGSVEMSWSTGNTKYIPKGSKVFLMRQGQEPKGVVGVGITTGPIEEKPHWDLKKRTDGRTSNIVPVTWQRLSSEPLISRDVLINETGENHPWDRSVGGTEISGMSLAILEQFFASSTKSEATLDALSFANTLSDLDHSNDHIGIKSDVEAISTLISVNKVEPPLSLAIFGDWGSGKTFLMHKVMERVAVLEGLGKKQHKESAGKDSTSKSYEATEKLTRYCKSILQIEFNAWHYTESNLWASMVNHILEKLQGKFLSEIDNANGDKGVIDKLFKELETAKLAIEETQTQIETAKTEINEFNEKISAAKVEAGDAQDAYVEAISFNIWNELTTLLKSKSDSDEVKAIKPTLKHFGFEEEFDSAQTMYNTLQQFQTVSGRANQIFGSMFATWRGVIGAFITALIILGAAIFSQFWPNGLVLQIGVTVSGILAWVAERAVSARKHLDNIQKFDAWLSAQKEKLEVYKKAEIAKSQTTLGQKLNRLETLQGQLSDLENRKVRAEQNLIGTTARDQMRRFIDNRVTQKTYSKHLGIVSTIRRDFENLSDLMFQDQQAKQSVLLKRLQKAEIGPIPNVERIILYIDDLDRCSPERVVEVLEAIHLLLAFRLFVVVVAVDPRWVLESLCLRYPHLAASAGDLSSASKVGSHYVEATAHDYLEKIFQLPFWVKPMTQTASEDLISGYFGFNDIADASDGEKYEDIIQQTSNQTPDSSLPDISEVETTKEIEKPVEETSPLKTMSERIDHAEEEARYKLINVQITEPEQLFIENLAQYLGDSPRRIKRFANSYRLLKAGMTNDEKRQFSDNRRSFEIVLGLLAVVTGAPSNAPAIFKLLHERQDKFSEEGYVKALSNTLTFAFKGLNFDSSLHQHEKANATGALQLISEDSFSQENINLWVPRVMRYTFRSTSLLPEKTRL